MLARGGQFFIHAVDLLDLVGREPPRPLMSLQELSKGQATGRQTLALSACLARFAIVPKRDRQSEAAYLGGKRWNGLRGKHR
jgi:hypothetical protein